MVGFIDKFGVSLIVELGVVWFLGVGRLFRCCIKVGFYVVLMWLIMDVFL